MSAPSAEESHPESSLGAASRAVREAIDRAQAGLVGRRSLVELVVLAAVASEHLLVIGPPGTAKSAAVRRVARELGGRYFEYLLSRFTEPTELFGAVDLVKLREGRVEVQTAGMLPDADLAFLDEVFLGSTAILNNLLSLLNERRFRHGHTDLRVPLRVCVGASNALPTESNLAAFADRFLLRAFVEPLEDAQLEELLEEGWGIEDASEPPATDLEAIDTLRRAVPGVDLAAVRPRIADAARTLRNGGIELSDRRVVKLQRLVAAAAVTAGREVAVPGDLWPVLFAVPTQEGQLLAADLLRDLLDTSDHPTLHAAAEEASAGPRVRARRLTEAARALLSDQDSEDDADGEAGDSDGSGPRRLRLEAVAREIDAAFAPDALPEELAHERRRLVEALEATAPEPPEPVLTDVSG